MMISLFGFGAGQLFKIISKENPSESNSMRFKVKAGGNLKKKSLFENKANTLAKSELDNHINNSSLFSNMENEHQDDFLEDKHAENINIDDVGLRNQKHLKMYTRVAKTLIKNEEKQIYDLLDDWKQINGKTKEIGLVLKSNFNLINITNENLTIFDSIKNKIADVQKLIDSQAQDLQQMHHNLTVYNKILSTKRERSKFFKKELKHVDEMKIEAKIKSKHMNAKKLFSNEINVGGNEISDSIIEFDKDFSLRFEDQQLDVTSLIAYQRILKAFRKSCGNNLERCFITNEEIAATNKKNNLIANTLISIKNKLFEIKHKN